MERHHAGGNPPLTSASAPFDQLAALVVGELESSEPQSESAPSANAVWSTQRLLKRVRELGRSSANASASASASSPPPPPSPPLLLPLPARYVESNDHRVQAQRHDLRSLSESLQTAVEMRQRLTEEGYTSESAQTQQTLLEAVPALPADLARLISSYRLSTHPPFLVSSRYGPSHADSRLFSTLSDPIPTLLLSGWVVRQVIGWGAEYCNGVQLVYGPADNTPSDLPPAGLQPTPLFGFTRFRGFHSLVEQHHESMAQRMVEGNRPGFVTSTNRPSTHHRPHRGCFTLQPNEYIRRVEWRVGGWGESGAL